MAMSAATQTRIFGIRLGIDPKILVVGLLAIAAVIFWFNTRGGYEGPTARVMNTEQASPIPSGATKGHGQADRRRGARQERGTLRLRTVDATRGDIDPTLRLDFLDRLAKVQAPTSMRNLFEAGPATQAGVTGTVPSRVIPVKTPELPIRPNYPISPQISANIPYKYYGFAKPSNSGDANRGFFMEGDNVLVAVEGQLLQNRYLVVQLTPNEARIEDTQVKLGKTLPVVPEAIEQPGAPGQAVATPDMNPGIVNQGIDDNSQ
jgi:hypothetical protein